MCGGAEERYRTETLGRCGSGDGKRPSGNEVVWPFEHSSLGQRRLGPERDAPGAVQLYFWDYTQALDPITGICRK